MDAIIRICLILVSDPACQILKSYKDRLSGIILTERLIALLHTEGVISEAIVTEIEKHGYLFKGSTLLAVYTSIAEDRSKLIVLAGILQKTDEAESLANDIAEEYSESVYMVKLVSIISCYKVYVKVFALYIIQ